MRRISILMLIAMLATMLVGTSAATATKDDTDRSLLDRDLAMKVAKDGSVRVIMGVRAAFAPEGNLPSRQAVTAQRQGIAQAQEALRSKLEDLNARAVEAIENIPFMVAEVDQDALQALAADPNVTSINRDKVNKLTLAESVPRIGANLAHSSGYRGANQIVAVLDSGVDKAHPFLQTSPGTTKVISEACYSTTNTTDGSTHACPSGFSPGSTAPGSGVHCTGAVGCDHGTHVAGIAAGRNGSYGGQTFNGVAPDARLIAIQVFSKFYDSYSGSYVLGAYDSDIVKGLQRVYNIRGSFGTSKIASVNMSLGGARYSRQDMCDRDNAATKTAIANLRAVGIATVIASGNESFKDSMASPGCISNAISVGASTNSDAVSSFSNTAPFLSLLAPGGDALGTTGDILSSVPGGGYAQWPGTSMATPHVAGAWALMKQRAPGASVPQVLAAMQTTGKAVTDKRAGANYQVIRRIQVNTALSKLSSACGNYESNGNTYTYAREFPVGHSVQLHSFCATGDKDWAKFKVTRGSSLMRIMTSGLATYTDTVVALYSASNLSTPIAVSDNISSTNKASRIQKALAPGLYYVRAYQKDGAGSAGRRYNLSITRLRYTAAACNVDEPNDDPSTQAKTITVGGSKNYAFCETPDSDIVKFTAAANKNYLFEANPVGSKVDAAIDVWYFDDRTLQYLGTIDQFYTAGAIEQGILCMGPGSLPIYLVYYDWPGSYGPTRANAYSAKVSTTTLTCSSTGSAPAKVQSR